MMSRDWRHEPTAMSTIDQPAGQTNSEHYRSAEVGECSFICHRLSPDPSELSWRNRLDATDWTKHEPFEPIDASWV